MDIPFSLSSSIKCSALVLIELAMAPMLHELNETARKWRGLQTSVVQRLRLLYLYKVVQNTFDEH